MKLFIDGMEKVDDTKPTGTMKRPSSPKESKIIQMAWVKERS